MCSSCPRATSRADSIRCTACATAPCPSCAARGGLADSVQHYDPAQGTGTGVVFNDFDSPALEWALNTALDWYAQPAQWSRLVQNGMAQDFSWQRQGERYLELYRRITAA
jgi:starch synthase